MSNLRKTCPADEIWPHMSGNLIRQGGEREKVGYSTSFELSETKIQDLLSWNANYVHNDMINNLSHTLTRSDNSIPDHTQDSTGYYSHRRLGFEPFARRKRCHRHQHKPGFVIDGTSLLRIAINQSDSPKSVHCRKDEPYGATCDSF
jgi:hypothetical protein